MAEPERDDGDVDAGVQESHGRGVAQGVHGDVLAAQRRAGDAGGREVVGEAVLDGVVAEPSAGAGREQWVVRCAGVFGEPAAEPCQGVNGRCLRSAALVGNWRG